MNTQWTHSRWFVLLAGAAFGWAVATYWPHEPAYGYDVDRSERMVMINVPTRAGNSDAIFVMDLVTGTLTGAAFNSQVARFTQFYQYNVAADFPGIPDRPEFVIGPNILELQQQAQTSPARGAIVVAELTTGVVHMYAFPYSPQAGAAGRSGLTLLDSFRFRQ